MTRNTTHSIFTLPGREARSGERRTINFTLRDSALGTSAAGIHVAIAVLAEKFKTLATVRRAGFSKLRGSGGAGGEPNGAANI